MQDLQVVVDRFIAGEIGSERLPLLAAEALAEGSDSPALRELAGLSRADVREARDLFMVPPESLVRLSLIMMPPRRT
ncbi:hypothetical protein ABZ754_00230 [Micromonospora purpureochromogenes]|uniref:hypothetical protein n=1 Tax=Micromonospora purpureochromogenes TaxID=47872 RepID=UPI003404BAF6